MYCTRLDPIRLALFTSKRTMKVPANDNNKMTGGSMSILKTCGLIVIVTYGITDILIESLYRLLPVGLSISLLLFIAITVFRLKPPAGNEVQEVLGDDPLLENGPHNLSGLDIIKVVAHRGAGLDAPENTIEAFQMCADKGCRMIEFDVNLTKDDIPVVVHDGSLERVAGVDRNINAILFKDVSGFDVGAKHPLKDKFKKVKIPSLIEVVEELLKSKQKMIIDTKRYDSKMVSIILDLFEKYPSLYSNAVVSSFFPNFIYMVRRRNPQIICSLAWRPHIFAYGSYSAVNGPTQRRETSYVKHLALTFLDDLHEWLLPKVTYYMLGLSLVLLHKDACSPTILSKWRTKGVRVMTWTVNTPAEKMYMAKVLKVSYLTDTLVGENTVHGKAS